MEDTRLWEITSLSYACRDRCILIKGICKYAVEMDFGPLIWWLVEIVVV